MLNPIRRIGVPILTLCALLSAYSVQALELTIAAANSTCAAVKTVGEQYSSTRNLKINYICKSSGLLAKGIRGGAIQPDIYISANKQWMDYMVKGGLVAADKVISPWGNRLVISAPADSPLEINTWNDLVSDKIKTILIGDPGTAPFGRYAKQAMKNSGIWEQARQKITTKKHITLLAETLAQSDNETVGILFSTNLTDRLRSIYPIDPSLHPAIRYYMAPLEQSSDLPAATALIDYICGDPGMVIFETAGFNVNSQ